MKVVSSLQITNLKILQRVIYTHWVVEGWDSVHYWEEQFGVTGYSGYGSVQTRDNWVVITDIFAEEDTRG